MDSYLHEYISLITARPKGFLKDPFWLKYCPDRYKAVRHIKL